MEYLFKAISIEDSEADAIRLAELLKNSNSVNYCGNARSMTEGRTLLEQERPDLLFLDIELPDGNAVNALSELRQSITWPMQIVIYTVYDNYVLQALRNAAFDYLIKPLQPEELNAMLQRFAKDYAQRQEAAVSGDVLAKMHQNSVLMINTIMGYHSVRVNEIVYAEHISGSKYWCVYLANGTSQMLRKGTNATTILALSKNFVQVNNRQVINLDFLGILRKDICSLMPPYEHVELSVTRSYVAGLQEHLLFL
jgi:two-component system LytT family response regulator